jgi:hypothetical protein
MPNLFSLLRGKRHCALFTTVLMIGDVDTVELEALCYRPIDVNGGGLGTTLPVVHDQLLSPPCCLQI